MKKIGILTSGGDTPGMNAAVRAVVRMGLNYNDAMLGIYHGYQGLMEGHVQPLTNDGVHGITQRGGTILRTARSEIFRTPAGCAKAMDIIHAYEMDAVIVIGGDGSYRGAKLLSEHGANVMCLPGTIDNDLGYTDFTIGFDTAVNNVMGEMDKILDTMRSHDRVGVIEVMGRNCGDIALWSAMTGPADIVLTPESPLEWSEAARMLMQSKLKGHKTCLVVIAEGAGHAADFAKFVEETTDVEIRPVVLGYIQRGGAPSAADRMLAARLGARAVDLIHEEQRNRAVGIRDNHIIDVPLDEAIESKQNQDEALYNLHLKLNRFNL
ncbi:MAG: ATP-dependent 6-phosphofructokinase [Eubacteriales bacterium]|nr:ATP-dependent 6-phosphofructokinase [Eubacteriales bacterium]